MKFLSVPLMVALVVAALCGCAPESARAPWRSIVEAAMPAVVRLEVAPEDGETAEAEPRFGSGFVVDPRGYVLTNSHVVGAGGSITVSFQDGSRYRARVVDVQPWVDLALLRVEHGPPMTALRLARSGDVRQGDEVLALGSPLDFPFSATRGVVSGFDRTYTEQDAVGFLQHDAALNPGSSGGPLLNLEGEVVGINAASAAESMFDIGISLAVPVDLARRYVAAVTEQGRYAHGVLGVRVRRLTPDVAGILGISEAGVLVERVAASSTAAVAGIAVGDVLIALDRVPITSPRRLGQELWMRPPATTVLLTMQRDGLVREIELRLGSPSAEVAERFHVKPSIEKLTADHETDFGLTIADAQDALRPGGVRISAVAPDSPASRAGLGEGDRLLMLNGRHLPSAAEAEALLADPSRRTLVALVVREGAGQQYVVLTKRAAGRQRQESGAQY